MQKLIKRREPRAEPAALPDDLHPVLKRIYLNRGVSGPQQLATDLAGLLTPADLKGVAPAVAILADALAARKTILIVGDFDADGATSSALAVSALQAMGAGQVDFLVPNRFDYGYGLTPEIVEVACRNSPDIILTVDNGISSIDGVALANQRGIEVVVTDHHLPGAQLPDAAAIVNPNQLGCQFASKNLAGVGVIFYLLSALRAELRQRGWFEQQQIPEPAMAEYLDLVALGTVADVVPLDANNRILVTQGIKRIRAGFTRPGITALLEIAGRNQRRLVSEDFGFAIGPRLNAAGRLDDISIGIRCLLSDDQATAYELAKSMDDLNRDRRAIEGSMRQEAQAALKDIELTGDLPWGLCLHHPEWHQGVIGILASRIKEQHHRPVIIFADADQQGMIKGSARSIPGLHIRDALDNIATKHPQLLTKFGGHAMAAGMSLQKAHFEDFRQAFDEEVRRQLKEDHLRAVIYSDGELSPEDLNLELAQQLRSASPWGQNFPAPVFDGEFYLVQQRLVGEKHLKMVLSPDPEGQRLIDAIAFNVDLAKWPDHKVSRIKAAYKLDANEFRGKESAQLMVEYFEVVAD